MNSRTTPTRTVSLSKFNKSVESLETIRTFGTDDGTLADIVGFKSGKLSFLEEVYFEEWPYLSRLLDLDRRDFFRSGEFDREGDRRLRLLRGLGDRSLTAFRRALDRLDVWRSGDREFLRDRLRSTRSPELPRLKPRPDMLANLKSQNAEIIDTF